MAPVSNQSSACYRWYVVAILTLAYLVSFLDRQILALMVGPIKADLQLADTEALQRLADACSISRFVG